jgi:aspartate/methionine/tyrosine aminotransferase
MALPQFANPETRAGTQSNGPVIADRVRGLKASVTVAFMNRAKAMQREGVDVLSFAAGEPDFDTPHQVKEAAEKALEGGMTKYMPTMGDPETRAAIAKKLVTENGIPTTAEHIAISAGGKHALFVALHCLIDPPKPRQSPSEVLLPVPAWVSYAPVIELAGGKVVELPTGPEADFKISPEQLRKAITARTRMFIINSPSNPCGTMYSPAELRAIAEVLAEAARTVAPGLVILSDELYEKIVYGGIPHFSIGSVPEIAERTLTINGLSKAYAMTGWRIGYAAGSGEFGKKLINAMATLQGQMTTNITHHQLYVPGNPDGADADRAGCGAHAPGLRLTGAGDVPPGERPSGAQVPAANRRLLRFPRRQRLLREDEQGRAKGQLGTRNVRGTARRGPPRLRPGRGLWRLWQEPCPDLLRVQRGAD